MKGRYTTMTDEAWEKGDLKTNPMIVDGVKVRLLYDTVADGKQIEKGALGTVVHALTPKIYNKAGTSPYFANVDLTDGTRIRVPHRALVIIQGGFI
jgi:hypothetical protein